MHKLILFIYQAVLVFQSNWIIMGLVTCMPNRNLLRNVLIILWINPRMWYNGLGIMGSLKSFLCNKKNVGELRTLNIISSEYKNTQRHDSIIRNVPHNSFYHLLWVFPNLIISIAGKIFLQRIHAIYFDTNMKLYSFEFF